MTEEAGVEAGGGICFCFVLSCFSFFPYFHFFLSIFSLFAHLAFCFQDRLHKPCSVQRGFFTHPLSGMHRRGFQPCRPELFCVFLSLSLSSPFSWAWPHFVFPLILPCARVLPDTVICLHHHRKKQKTETQTARRRCGHGHVLCPLLSPTCREDCCDSGSGVRGCLRGEAGILYPLGCGPLPVPSSALQRGTARHWLPTAL